ncbi:MazG nucleotide pyrophosphohydrolase domain-containing protein [Arthrobacter sp. PAMC 25486]|uniref:MazG nucleotide pyrophosphohydrolase domain-containing protein n=1 Tax=Arthrobacter sp. PAMC 25486 TaxID=1494608 RepID=UPI00068A9D15|nr:MazG nucleotide pyrophosphohydrolase domain-containing protein [Arthrobacter sp. PAMC 25486]
MARLVAVIAALREHCPWTAALTHDSLTTYLLEESYELIEAIESGHGGDIANELGDILLQVVLHARLAEESGSFDLADVVRGLSEKMIRRSPHVFHPDGTLQSSFPATIAEIEAVWERVKADERAATGAAVPVAESPFAGIPASLPALAMAQKSVERAARAGIGVPALAGNIAGTIEPGTITTEDELGKLLFDVVRGAHECGLDAERALRQAVRDFQGR